MQQTKTYKFNLIETSDTFSPDALNANARTAEAELARVEAETAKADAALLAAIGSGGKTCRIQYGTYVGNGLYGTAGTLELTFDFKPVLVAISYQNLIDPTVLMRGIKYFSTGTVHVTWGENSVSWYTTHSTRINEQCNNSGATYYYVAIGEALDGSEAEQAE